MTELEAITMEAELVAAEADRDIVTAVRGRRAMARRYVIRLRRRHPDATPTEVVQMLERHYGVAISAAGAVLAASTVAADIGIAMIPGVGPAAAGAKSAGQQAAKKAGQEAVKAAAKKAAKEAALSAAKSEARRAAALLPAGGEQLQFEITAIFGLALAEIHGMSLDPDQARALVHGLSNGRVSQQTLTEMAADVAAQSQPDDAAEVAAQQPSTSHWAATLAAALPAGRAQTFVRTMETGHLDTVRDGLGGKQQAAIDYGIAAVASGVARFVFGQDVVTASRMAFAAPPPEFPSNLGIPTASTAVPDDDEAEPNRAVAALEDAARATGSWVSAAAGAVVNPFRKVDLDGDGIPDEPRALTAVKGIGDTIAGAATGVRGEMAVRLKPERRRRRAAEPDQTGPLPESPGA